ncbi:MAG TPA: tetratricopeptide repeat protein [Candidatus Methylomirabilis sp.]|nr:tetratricopeptide repeat protein [Candidatus Methylomirabilis sp.]
MRDTRIRTKVTRAITAGLLLAGCVVIVSPGPAVADPSRRSDPETRKDPQYAEGEKAIKRGDFETATRLFEAVVAREPRNADAYNLLAYSIRRSGNAARAIPLYEKALAIDPKHRGAHEYIGEAYLILGDLPKAREHLAALDKLCFLPCEEYTDLKKAVQQYEASQGRTKPTSRATP